MVNLVFSTLENEMETGVNVGDVMGKGAITVSPKDTVKRACEIMEKHDLSGISVMSSGKLVGVLTQGDLVPPISKGRDIGKLKVEEIMGCTPQIIGPEADVRDAAVLMVKKRIKRLPVVKDGKLIGMLTQGDIVRIAPSVFDLLVDKASLEDGGLVLDSESPISGECEECGNYSENLTSVGGTLMCRDCSSEAKED